MKSVAQQMQEGRARAVFRAVEQRGHQPAPDPPKTEILGWYDALDEFTREYWSALVKQAGSFTAAARIAGVHVSTVSRFCRELCIPSPDKRGGWNRA